MIGRIDLFKTWDVQHNAEQLASQDIRSKHTIPLYVSYPRQADGEGWYPIGFEQGNVNAFDAMNWYGLELIVDSRQVGNDSGIGNEVEGQDSANNRTINEISITAHFINSESVHAKLSYVGSSEQQLCVSWKDFEVESAKATIWRYLTGFTIDSNAAEIKGLSLIKAKAIDLSCKRKGLSGDVGEELHYELSVINCSVTEQLVSIKQQFKGWESLIAYITPEEFIVAPNSSTTVQVSFTIHQDMVEGGHESSTIVAIGNGNHALAARLELRSMRKLPHPYIYWNHLQWKQRMALIQQHDCFQAGYERILQDAEDWVVSPPLPIEERDYCYNTSEEHYIMSAAYAYALTGEIRYAEKLALFFRYFTDPHHGYPRKLKGCSQSYVQEGHFFQHLAIPYDIIYDSGLLSDEDKAAIEHCFILYMDMLDFHIRDGHISNWLLSEITGAVYCALALQDMDRIQRFVFGPGGTVEQLQYGFFNDGWWYECTVSYNTWVGSMCLHTAHALLPFGINLIHTHFPAPYNRQVNSTYRNQSPILKFAMVNERWGGNEKNYICIKDMFDAVIPFLDYRGVIFGINDSHERKLEGVHFGSTYDLAYHYYRDEQYIPVINMQETVDPIFGHYELPDVKTVFVSKNAYSDNIGIVMTRSQKANRPQREQIQAVLRYGSHGYAHGHFDRTELLSIMRYGRSFFNPEHVWWGYLHFMYKFYVQNSMTKNMVVVDNKMQLPADSRKTLFYSGSMIQVSAVETTTQWAYPPYGGMIYRQGETLQQRSRLNACSLPAAPDEAKYGELSHYSEPVHQKRLMVLADDYIVLFDWVSGSQQHHYDCLFQIKGFQGLSGQNLTKLKHSSQWTENPLSDAQFITDCHWYEAKGAVKAQFVTIFGEGEDLRGTRSFYNEPGILQLDVYTAWPPETQHIIGRAAEDHGMLIPIDYRVEVDGVTIQQASLDAWLLGEGRVEIELSPATKKVSLIVKNHPLYNEQGYPYQAKQGLFWGYGYIVTSDNSHIPITELPITFHNIDTGYGIGKDYENGRVTIIGEEYAEAIPTSPLDHQKEAVIHVHFDQLEQSLHPIKFVGLIGADAFPGDEAQRRSTYGIRTYGENTRYVTVIEPHEGQAVVQAVTADNENKVNIHLADGRMQVITVHNLHNGENSLVIEEYQQGKLLRSEHT